MFAIRDGKAVELHVTPGVRTGGWVEVTGAELAAGDKVATSALTELVDGSAVSVKAGA